MQTPIAAIDDILGFHVRLAHGAVLRQFNEHFAALGLTQKQISVLWLTQDQPGIAQSDLARRLQMDRATMMAIVHKLEAKALIERAGFTIDRRRIGLRLTDAGVKTLAQARQAIGEHEAWLRARFTPGEVAELIGLLRKIHS